ncbi:MAG: hypothetical protein LBO09_05860 [Candidatus Peribacteria bacterium]|nr:hypothetical protein [Candidatus Peribacteria bacterium]
MQKELSRFTMTGFAGVEIDGTELSGENYLADGTTATTITLKADYLNTLSTGDHLLTVRFSDGIITTGNFIIVSAPSNPTNPTNPS